MQNKVDHIAAACPAVGTEARPGVGIGVNLQTGRFVFVERAQQTVVPVGL